MKKIMALALAVLFICMSGRASFGQQVDMNELVQETQKRSDTPGEMTFVWWIPQEYWQASFAQNPSVTPQQSENVLNVFRPYIVVAVVDGKMGTLGSVAYKTEAEIRSVIQLKDKSGTLYQPLGDDLVNVDTKSFLGAMKPVMASVLGPMGANMYFFLFPAKDKNGTPISEAKKEGYFSVLLGEREFRWNLPLGSLLGPKTCPVCKQKLSGAYKYCPWDGTKLE